MINTDGGKGVGLWRFFFHVFDVSPGGQRCPRGAGQARRPLMRHLHWLWSDKTAPLSFTCLWRWCYNSDGGIHLITQELSDIACLRMLSKVDKNLRNTPRQITFVWDSGTKVELTVNIITCIVKTQKLNFTFHLFFWSWDRFPKECFTRQTWGLFDDITMTVETLKTSYVVSRVLL